MRHFLFIFVAFLLLPGSLFGEDAARGFKIIKEADIKNLEDNPGKRYAICVGVNGYENPEIQDLQKAQNDAKALGDALQKYGQFDNVFVLTDDIDPRFDEMQHYPRLRNLRRKLDYLKDFINPNDLVLFSFSGHGISNSEGKGFLLPTDVDYYDVFDTSLGIQEVVDWLKELNISKSLLLIDACRETVTEQATNSATGMESSRFVNCPPMWKRPWEIILYSWA